MADPIFKKIGHVISFVSRQDKFDSGMLNRYVQAAVKPVTGNNAARTALGATLTTSDTAFQFYDTDDKRPYWWSGTEWV